MIMTSYHDVITLLLRHCYVYMVQDADQEREELIHTGLCCNGRELPERGEMLTTTPSE